MAFAAAKTDKSLELKALRSQLKELEKNKSKLSGDENELNNRIKLLESDIGQAKSQELNLKAEIGLTQKKTAILENTFKKIKSKNSAYGERVLAVYADYYKKFVYPQRMVRTVEMEILCRAALQGYWGLLRGSALELSKVKVDKISLEEKSEKLMNDKVKLGRIIRAGSIAGAAGLATVKKIQDQKLQIQMNVDRLALEAKAIEKLLDELAKIDAQQAKLKLGSQPNKDQSDPHPRYPWPVRGRVVSKFGRQSHPELGVPVYNNGVWIQTESNRDVHAVAEGTVVFADAFRVYGPTVIIDHGDEIYTVYGQLGRITVKQGAVLSAGNVVARTGKSDHPQIYFELRYRGHAENPLEWLDGN